MRESRGEPAVGSIGGAGLTPAQKAAIAAAGEISGPLPSGVEIEVLPHYFEGNPQVRIRVDGRTVYFEYLYHSERSLGRSRRKWWNPLTWFRGLGEPSPDMTQRFAALMTLAAEGAARVRASRA